jgi:predicted outer membrane repeat protein
MVGENARVEIIDSSITGNSGHAGGIHIKPGATASIGNCNISGNSASNKGGAIYNEGAMSLKGGSIAKNTPDDIHCP